MDFNIYNSLVLAGIVQGIIFVGVVLSSEKFKSKSVYFLVALIFSFSLGNLQYILQDLGILTYEKMSIYVYLPWSSLTAVLIYFYVSTFLYSNKKTSTLEKLLFFPFLTFSLLFVVLKIGILLGDQNGSFRSLFDFMFYFHEIVSVLFTIAMLIMALRKIKCYEKDDADFNKTTVRTKLNWLKITLFIFFILTLMWAYLTIKNIFYPEVFTSFYVLWLGVSAVIYWLGHIGVYKYGILQERKKIRATINKNKKMVQIGRSKNEHIEVLENLLVNDKIYLDPNLTLESIANKLNLSTSHLSRILNAELKTNFAEYLNSFRIEEAKNYLMDPDFAKYTIIAIGLEAGFNSKSAFFNVFKKSTGKTPLEFKREHIAA